METKNKLFNERKPLLFLTWEPKPGLCHADTAFLWRGNEFRIRVYSTHALMCGSIYFDIYFNKQFLRYHTLHHSHSKPKLNIPDIMSGSYKLVIDAFPTSLEIIEMLMTPDEIRTQEETNLRIADKQYAPAHQPTADNPKKYDFKPRENESWIGFADNLSTSEFKVAFPAPKVVFWVKKSLGQQFNSNISLFNYEFYSRSVDSLPLRLDGFECSKAYDVCEKVKDGFRCTLHFEIADRNNNVRKFDSFAEGERGIISMLAFLGKVSKYADWEGWDSHQDVDDVDENPDESEQKEDQQTGEPALAEETNVMEELNYPERPYREKESWISVSKDYKTEELETPYNDNNLLMWIHAAFDYKTYDGGWHFKYELFSSDLQPMQLKEGNFTCICIYDFSQRMGCGNYTTIQFEISDITNTIRKFRGFRQMEFGVIEAIEFMRMLSRFDDWKEYDEMKALTRSLGKTDVELDKMIASELNGSGIRLG